MAMHGKRIFIKMVNKATGTFYLTVKNPKNTEGKLKLRKYDKKTRRVEEFTEEKAK